MSGSTAGKTRVRAWEVFPGRSEFWCGGRLMTAPRPAALLLTLSLICSTCALHFAFDAPFLARKVSPLLPAAGGALALVTLAALLRTALSDPGIVPRATPAEADGTVPELGRPPPRARDVLVRGRLVRLKYCFTCKLLRPPRASHCSLCDNCVERFDHHCPWVGNCVGRRNYRHFYLFVVCVAFLCVWVCACALAHVALTARTVGLASALKQEPASAVVAAICLLSVWSVLGLAGFHTYLAATEQTTNEDIKGAFARARSDENPYSRGGACANCWHVLCAPVPPSLLRPRAFVEDDDAMPPALRPPSPDHRHAYMNHSLDLDSLPLQEVRVETKEPSASEAAHALSASRLRLLLDTTMIDAALDLDDLPSIQHAS